MTIQQAKEIDMVDYLSSLGYEPAKVKGKSYWYLSPLHEEKTPSFKVNRQINRWYDFAEGKGGNLVDFGTLFHKCPVSDFLQKLGVPGIGNKLRNADSISTSTYNEDKQIEILSVHEVSSYPLVRYLQSRKISSSIAQKFVQEVRYKIGDKIYYALGFKNDLGGYELRNENFKGSCSPKDTTFINNGSGNLSVFEGFFDFLAYKQIHHNQQENNSNFLILNSTAFFDKSIDKMLQHSSVHLFLDNDKTGQKCSELAINLDSKKFIDERPMYRQYNDLNDWLISFGRSQKQQSRLKP